MSHRPISFEAPGRFVVYAHTSAPTLYAEEAHDTIQVCIPFARARYSVRRQSEGGRAIMMEDLNGIHETLLETMKALSLLSGIDLEALAEQVGKARGTDTDSPDAHDENSVFHVPI